MGVLGSGREQLAGTLFGAKPRSAGTVRVAGQELLGGKPREAMRLGVGYVPPERAREGLVMSMSARENLTLPSLAGFRRRAGCLD